MARRSRSYLCRIQKRKDGGEFASPDDAAFWNQHRDAQHGGDDQKILEAVQNSIDGRSNKDKEMSALDEHLDITTNLLRDPENHGTTHDGRSVFFMPSSGKYHRTSQYVLDLRKVKPGDDKYWKRRRFEEIGLDFASVTSKGTEELTRVREEGRNRPRKKAAAW